MLSLRPPYQIYGNVVVGRDYTDPQQFWYFPGRPRLAVDEHGRPTLRLLLYRDLATVHDETATVGFLFFDTVLSLPDEDKTLQAIAGHLKRDLQLDAEPRLAPLPYRAGTVKLIFLDRVQQLEPPPGGGQGGGQGGGDQPEDWVSVLEGSGVPSLYGENRAIFSVGLTRKAADLVRGSFEGFLPAGVVYDLTYVAMQRAFEVHVEVDWHVVYDYVRTYEEHRFLFYSDDSEKIVAKLVESRVIKITGAIEGVGDEGMQAQFDEVRKQLATFVFEKFFEPKINPQDLLDGNIPRTIMGFLGDLRDGGLPAHFGCSKKELHDDELRTLSIDYTVDRAVERRIAPQGHLSAFWADFDPPVTADDVITVVDSEDSLWRTVSLQAVAVTTFGPSDVQDIVVEVAYGDWTDAGPGASARRSTILLDAAHPTGSVDHWYDPAVGPVAHFRYTVAFGPQAAVGQGVLMTSPWRDTPNGIALVNPAELYRVRSLLFQRSALLSAELFPEVLAHVRYTDAGTGWTFTDSGLLGASGTWTTTFRLPVGSPWEVEYRVEFPQPGAAPLASDWVSTTDDTVTIQDPRQNLFPVRILVGDRANLEELLVDLAYDDPDAGIHDEGSITISKDTVNEVRTWVFHRADPAKQRYRWSQTVIGSDGTVLAPGWVESEASTLVVGASYAAKWTIVPEVVGPPLAASGLARIVVSLRYDDDQHGYHAAKDVTFTAPGEGEGLPLTLQDPTLRSYTYSVRWILANGFEKTAGPLASTDTYLVVSSRPPL